MEAKRAMTTEPSPACAAQLPDFVIAHRRHWDDGNLLCDHARLANAAYLFGFSSECGLKAVMQALGWMPVGAEGVPRKLEHRQHIQKLWPLYGDLARNREGARYGLCPDNPFCDWSHHDRYANGQHVEREDVRRYRKATAAVARVLDLARVDGKL